VVVVARTLVGMNAQAVAERLGQVQLVDVRQAAEWEAGHIHGAIHIPKEDLAGRLDELDRSRPVVTVCRAGTRGDDAAEWLRGQGFDAQSLDGGLLSWKWAGLALTGPIAEPPPTRDEPSVDLNLHDELLSVMSGLHERFGEREPTEEELHGFLRDRLIAEGRTPEEAEAFLADMGEG
jgi:rhodanese-related sulfurtransferase